MFPVFLFTIDRFDGKNIFIITGFAYGAENFGIDHKIDHLR